MRALAALCVTGALTVLAWSAAPAQSVPPLLPPQPVSATGPTGRVLGTAYSAISRATVLDPAAATQATFAYRSAVARLRMGDAAGARAEAARAMAIASAADQGVPASSLPAESMAAPGGVFPSLAAASREPALLEAALPASVRQARMAVLRAAACGADTTKASAHLRDAIDAYVSGDAARTNAEARAATQAAAATSRPSSGCRRTTRTP
jgi:hypothetical protein